MDTTQDQQLSLQALRSGDQAEFARLVERFSGPIYRLALRMLDRQEDAEDVLQNTFLNALTHIADFEGRSSLGTWLYRIAANEALMLLRRRRPEVSVTEEPQEGAGESQPNWFVDWTSLPEDTLLDSEARTLLDRAIQSLPETLRVVFVLRDLQDLSIRETAEVLGLTETNVKTRLLRARLHLREQLSAYYSERLPKD